VTHSEQRCKIRTNAADKNSETFTNEIKSVKIHKKNHGFHGNKRFFTDEGQFQGNVTAVKS